MAPTSREFPLIVHFAFNAKCHGRFLPKVEGIYEYLVCEECGECIAVLNHNVLAVLIEAIQAAR